MEINERVIAIVRLVVGLIVMAASACGLAIDADSVFTVILCILAIAAFAYSWWKNNNITEAVQQAQNYLNAIRNLKASKSDETDDDDESEDESEEDFDSEEAVG